MHAEASQLGVFIGSAPWIRRTSNPEAQSSPNSRTFTNPRLSKIPTLEGVAKMAITFDPMVRFGPNFARIIIFQFHGHLKGKG